MRAAVSPCSCRNDCLPGVLFPADSRQFVGGDHTALAQRSVDAGAAWALHRGACAAALEPLERSPPASARSVQRPLGVHSDVGAGEQLDRHQFNNKYLQTR